MTLHGSLRWMSVAVLALLVACDEVAPTEPLRPEDVVGVTIRGWSGGGSTPPTLQMAPGTTVHLTADVRDRSGNVDPRYPVDWSSSTAAITVDSAGFVTARVAGLGTVTATARGTTVSASVQIAAVGASTR
ncbi:MAG TPA: hypothetical protein VEA99_11875 [Gemmatimonadaceae bacterium]|nr:hypothetical protein [Gemmatimonadaceae bacterium]